MFVLGCGCESGAGRVVQLFGGKGSLRFVGVQTLSNCQTNPCASLKMDLLVSVILLFQSMLGL